MMVEKRHEQLGLNEETVLDMYRTMLLSRRIDERMASKPIRENSLRDFLPGARSCTGWGSVCADRQKD